MPRKGSAHFDAYPETTEVKHQILTDYLRSYAIALKSKVHAFHYVDGFAGTGTYGEGRAGSAPRAIDTLAEFQKPVAVTLIESNKKHAMQLRTVVQGHPHYRKLLEPKIIVGQFSEHVEDVLGHSIYGARRTVATFAFVDPCGVKGVRLKDLSRLLALPFGEVLMFWNYDGAARWLHAASPTKTGWADLIELFGDEQAVRDAIKCVVEADPNTPKDFLLRQQFARAVMRSSGARFVLPFRFPSMHADRVSHYLVHCCNHPLGFKIMKAVMRSRGSTVPNEATFDFRSQTGGQQVDLFEPEPVERERSRVLAALRNGPQRVSLFTDEWVARPDDRFTDRDYRQLLLALEREGLIYVREPKTGKEVPVSSRPARKGAPTLSSRFLISLRS